MYSHFSLLKATTTRTSGSRETLEDYTLRYAPLSFRRWGPGVVAVTAL
ncbi:hypothetical protein, partial [Klebsiella pneumoniae]